MQSVKDSRVSVTLWAEGRTGFVCSCCGHPDPQIWLTRSSPAEQKQSKRKHSSLYWLNNCPAFIRGKKPLTAKRLHSKALTCEQQRYCIISQTFGILLLSEQQSGNSQSFCFQCGSYNTAVHQHLKHLQAGAQGAASAFYAVVEVIRAFWPWKVVPLCFTHPSAEATWNRLSHFCNLQSHF